MNEVSSFYLALIIIPLLTLAALWFFRRCCKAGGKKALGYIITWNLLLTFFFLAVGFLSLETYYRFFVDTTDSFALNKISVRWFNRHYQANNVGVRDNIAYYPVKSPGKKHRVAFLGNSFTVGQGIKNVDDRFVNIIRRDCPDLEVHCLAANGLRTRAELKFVNRIAEKGYQFDYVVLCYALNDLVDLMPENRILIDRIYSDYKNEMGYLDSASYFINTWYYRLKAKNDADITNYYGFVKRGYAGPEWHEQQKCLAALADTIQRRGGKLLVVTFPFFNAVGGNTYEYQYIHQQLDRFWDGINIPNLDLLPTFSSYQPAVITVNKFDAHPNELAHRLAAESIEKFIRQHIKD